VQLRCSQTALPAQHSYDLLPNRLGAGREAYGFINLTGPVRVMPQSRGALESMQIDQNYCSVLLILSNRYATSRGLNVL